LGTDSGYYKEIIGKLNNLTKKEYIYYASLGIQFAVITGVSAFFIFSVIEMLARFSITGRTILFFLFVLAAAGAFVYYFLRPAAGYLNLFTKTDYFSTAKKVGQNFPLIKDDLLNAMQLVSFDESKNRYSPGLIDAAFKQIYNKTRTVEFEKIISFKKSRDLLLYTIGIIVFVSASFLLVPGLQAASSRLINFSTEFIPPAKYSFDVHPGNASITKGEDVNISVRVMLNNVIPGLAKNYLPSDVKIAVKSNEQTEFEYKPLTPDSLGLFTYNLSAVRSSFRYFIKAEDVLSEEYLVQVIDRPVIRTLDLTITSPSYSGILPVEQKDNGSVTALMGSNISFKISATKELGKAYLEFDDTTFVNLKTGSISAEGSFRIKGDNNYRIILEDKEGNRNLSPITYTIKALYDANPAIDMVSPNKDTNLGNDNRVPLFVKISDDYGFTKLVLRYRLSSSKYSEDRQDDEYSSLDIPINKSSRESEVNYVWNLSRMSLGVEDVVSYYLEVFDNDNISGPKSAKTSVFNVRVPALEEILAKADNTQQKAEMDMKEVLKEAEDLKKSLEKIDQELKKDQKDITWEEKEKIEKSLEKFDELQQKMEKVSDELNKMQQDLQKNNLLSKETLEKYMELQKLMDELSSEEMKKAMERMQNMLQKMNRSQVQQEMQKLKVDEEAFKKSIERTMNLLKRIQAEQKVDELVKRSEEITNEQEKVREENSRNQNNQKEEMQQRQDEITKDLDKFEEEMKDLAEKMEELKDLPKDELEKAMKEFEKQQNREKSEQASRQMQQNQNQQAQQNQQQVSKNMQQMQKMMQQLQESMQQANQVQAFTDMMKIMDNILTLSKQQEQLKKESQKLEPGSSRMKENAQKQNNLQKNLQKIMQQMGDLSQKTFAVSPEMGKALGDAMKQMQNSTQAMQNRNAPLAAMGQGEAMKSLNEAASLMKSSMESMMQGGGQGGMMSLMQQLQQLGQQQMNLNNMTQQLQQGNDGRLNPQQQAQLQKLTQQQELIRKSVEQLNNEARQSGKSKSLPGNLENISKEMQEIISGMRTEKLNDELIQKQEKILSRMLDATRSINERDFEKQRESYTGENIARQSPGELKLNSARGKDRIKDELNRAGREGYSKDYEELIRKYFEALQKDNPQ
jgi:hypothetical protein